MQTSTLCFWTLSWLSWSKEQRYFLTKVETRKDALKTLHRAHESKMLLLIIEQQKNESKATASQ